VGLDTGQNAAAFGYAGSGTDRSAFPKVRVVTVSECASRAVVDAEIGGIAGKGDGEQSLARRLYARLEEDWLLITGRNSYNWADWSTAADSGAALLWRVKSDLTLPVLDLLPDGSYRSVLVSPKITGKARVLRSRSPDMVRQEIYGYLLAHYAISALICAAATQADIDPDRVSFTRTVRIIGRAIGPTAFPPEPRRTSPRRDQGRHHQETEPQPAAPAPDLPQGHQATLTCLSAALSQQPLAPDQAPCGNIPVC
jgi:hypothetical protein